MGTTLTELLISVGATLGAALLSALALALSRVLRKLSAIEDVVCGQPADPIRGTDAVPSVGARLATLESAVLEDQAKRLTRLETRWDEHIAACALAGRDSR